MLIPSTKALICSLDLPEVAIKHDNIYGPLVDLNEEKQRDDL